MSPIVDSVTDLIGATPLVRLGRMPRAGSAEILVKLEGLNPGGSVKDRVALNLILRAERDGRIDADTTVIEPSTGNTGIGLAMVCAARGYRCIIVMPETMSLERIAALERFGAEVVLTPGRDDVAGAVREAEKIARRLPKVFVPSQFDNDANPDAHRTTTAREVLKATAGELHAFVAGVGTGGTLTGVGEAFAEAGCTARLVAVEPAGSPVLSGGRAGSHRIQGIGAGFVPRVLRRDLIHEVVAVSDRDAFTTMKLLAAQEGISAGISAGAALHAGLAVAERLGAGKRVVVLLADGGDRYLSLHSYFEL